VQKIGLPSGTLIEIIPPDPFEVVPELPGFTLEDARQFAISNRTDLRNLELAVELAQVGIDTQRNRPSLLFQGNYSQADRAQGFGDRESWSLMLNLSYTLFDSGRAETAADEARARRDALAVQLDDVRTLVELEVEAAYRELTNSLERIEVARATLETASEALRIAELGYAEGVIIYIDYKDADLGLRQAETLHLQAVYQYLIARSALRSALGVSELP
jgi:outer membrane protein TolC